MSERVTCPDCLGAGCRPGDRLRVYCAGHGTVMAAPIVQRQINEILASSANAAREVVSSPVAEAVDLPKVVVEPRRRRGRRPSSR